MRRLFRNPMMAAILVSIYLWLLTSVYLGFAEGFTASTETAVVDAFTTATSEFIADRDAIITADGIVGSFIWAITKTAVLVAFFVAELTAIFTLRYLTWIPEILFQTAGYALIVPPILYTTWVIVDFVNSFERVSIGGASE